MKKAFLFTIILLISSIVSFAQGICGNEGVQQKWIKDNPSILKHIEAEKRAWQKYNHTMTTTKTIITGTDTAYEVPVVFHIIHLGDTVGSLYNPGDTVLEGLLNYLNQSFAATWFDHDDTAHKGTYIPLKFILAKRGPDCSPSNGINRVDGSIIPGYKTKGVSSSGTVPGISDSALKNLSIWPARDYFNIWIVNAIEGGMVAGYAPWPSYTDVKLLDGMVLSVQFARPLPATGGTYHYSPPHEMGHSFGLYHTFEGGCRMPSECDTTGDEICDTEPHNAPYSYFGCDPSYVNMCLGGIPYDGVDYNIMNYTLCASRFTKGQKKRVLFTIKNYRMGLVNSLGATAPDTTFVSPSTACIPGVVNVGNGKNNGPCNIAFANMVTSSSGYAADGRLGYIDRTCIQQGATVLRGNSYQLSVSTTESPQNVNVWIDYNNDGIFQTTENVFSHSGSMADEVHTGMITIPSATVVTDKNLRMRIQADNATLGTTCDNLQNGQTEDYTVVIKVPAGLPAAATTTDDFKIFPNPATDRLTIETKIPANFIIYATDGKMVAQENTGAVINLSRLASGLYFIKAYDKSNQNLIGVQKLLKVNQY